MAAIETDSQQPTPDFQVVLDSRNESVIAVRHARLPLLALMAGLGGCAQAIAPSGGPPDSIPPFLIRVQPDSFAVMPDFDDEVRFQFSEAISERAIQGTVTIFPFEARPRVKKGKDELRVRPRAGWVDDRIYHMRIEPAIQDLFGNTLAAPILYVFSTGEDVPLNQVAGIVFDRITGTALRRGRVDMVHLPDSVRYGAETDSAGGFRNRALPAGDFLAIAYEDLNNNRQADAFDRADTVPLALGPADSLTLEFRVFRHDTAGPRLIEAQPLDTILFRLGFDGYLNPDEPITTDSVEVVSSQLGTQIALDTVMHAWEYEAWREARAQALAEAEGFQAEADADTLAAPVDTAAAPAAPVDSALMEIEREEPIALPARELFVFAAAPIPPGDYVVRVRRILNLSGLRADSEVDLEQPAVEEEPEEEAEPAPPPGPAGQRGRGDG